MPIEYPQVDETCLASSFASVLHMAGYVEAGQKMNANISQLRQGQHLLVNFINFVNKMGIQDAGGNRLVLRKQTAYNILGDTTLSSYSGAPVSVTLQAMNNNTTHAVAVYKDYIVDSSWDYALPRTKESLDWSCAPSEFFKVYRVYVLTR